MEIYYDDNDNRLSVSGVQDADGVAIADATVRVTSLVDGDGTPVDGVVTPLAVPVVEGAAGDYAVVLSGLEVDVGDVCTARIEVDVDGKHGEGDLRFRVRERRLG